MPEAAQQELIPKEQAPLVPAETPTVLQMIDRLTANPQIITTESVEALQRLAQLHIQMEEREAERQYKAAMSRVQAELPQFEKTAAIMVPEKDKGGKRTGGMVVRSRYAPIEDIDYVLQPLLDVNGLSVSFGKSQAMEGGKLYRVEARVSHSLGYAQDFLVDLPFDSSDYRTHIQSFGSTTSYARRQLLKNIFNFIERGEDDDAQGSAPISEKQVQDLQAALEECGADMDGFLHYMHVEKLEHIIERRLPRALAGIAAKQKQKAARAQ